MLWQRVKRTVADHVYAEIVQFRSWEKTALILADMVAVERMQPLTEDLIKSYADKAVTIIMRWDIRRVEGLRDLFPNYFPKSLSGGKLYIDMVGDNWVVEKCGT